MNQSFQVIDQSVSEQIQRKISISLDMPLTQISDFFSVLNIPDSSVFLLDVIKRVAALGPNFVDLMDDELDPLFLKTVKLAEAILESGVLSEIKKSFYETSIEELLTRKSIAFDKKALVDDVIYRELHGNCMKNPLFMICVYPVYLGDFGQENQEALNEYFMILGAILNQYLKIKNELKKDDLPESKLINLLYQFSLDVRKFDVHLGSKLNLINCRTIEEIVEQLRSVPHSAPNQVSLLKFARFIEGKTTLKTYPKKSTKNNKSFSIRQIIRGIVKVHDDFFIDVIDINDDASILFLEKVTEEDDKRNNNDCFVIPLEDPKLPKLFSEKNLNGYHRKHQNLIISPTTISDNRRLLALLCKISRSSGVVSKSDLKAVIFIMISMLTGSNPKNISAPKNLKENEKPVLGRINFKVLSSNCVQIFCPVLTANTRFAEGLDCYEKHSPFFEVTLPKVFSNIIFNVLKRYDEKFHGKSLTFDHHVFNAIKKILKSIKGAGFTLSVVVRNTVRLFHEASNGSVYIAYCLSHNSNSLAATQKHYASVSQQLLAQVFYQAIQEQFEINIESHAFEEDVYLGNHSFMKYDLLSEKIADYYHKSIDKEALVLSQFNNFQKYVAFIQFIFSAGRNVKKNKPFHELGLCQKLPQLYEKNRKQKLVNLFFCDDKRTKNASNIRFLVAPPHLDDLLVLENKLIKKLEKEQVVFEEKGEQFLVVNDQFKLDYFMQSDLARLDFDEGLRPNFLRVWAMSTLLNKVMEGSLKISAETIDAFVGHGHAGSEFWNPYSLKDPQVSLQEQIRFVELLVSILNLHGGKK